MVSCYLPGDFLKKFLTILTGVSGSICALYTLNKDDLLIPA